MMRALAAVLLLLAAAAPARAELRLCNRTSYVIYAATAAAASDVTVSGWTRIVPGDCRIAIRSDLAARAYYLYARSSPAHSGPRRAWSGQVALCAKDSNFSLHMPALGAQCSAADTYDLPFAPLDTHHMRAWTTTFRDKPGLSSMQAAAQAGLKRLLGDIGARDLGPPKAVDAALAAARKRLHVPDGASAAQVFDALETDAMRATAPAGYTICNDTDKTVWAAIASRNDKNFISRGWWAIAAGACAKAITEPVVKTAIYLRVERSKGNAIVSGQDKFCVTNIEFEIQGREHCAARGLTEAGFALTNAAGAPGFAAHVLANGLADYGNGTSK
jgi:uncharacterized membrane protein